MRWQDSVDFVEWFREAGYDETHLNDGVVDAMFDAYQAGKLDGRREAAPRALDEDDAIFSGGIRQEVYGR